MNRDVYRGARVLITGGAGFIGSNLARSLVDSGAEVTVVDSLIPEYGANLFNLAGYEAKLHLNVSDVRDPHSIAHLVRGKDFLFNLAGQVSHTDSMSDPFTDIEINVRSQVSILEACRRSNARIRILFASTRQIYGRPEALPVSETHPLVPVDVNGIDKLAAEQFHLLYRKLYGIPVTVLRLTNTYGPRMRVKDARQTFVGLWFRQVLQGETLRVFGDGTQLRDLVHVDDVCEAMLTALATPGADGEVFNVGGEPTSLAELAEATIRANGSGRWELVEFPSDRKSIDIGSYYADTRKIESALGWRQRTPLAAGLSGTLDYYRRHLKEYS